MKIPLILKNFPAAIFLLPAFIHAQEVIISESRPVPGVRLGEEIRTKRALKLSYPDTLEGMDTPGCAMILRAFGTDGKMLTCNILTDDYRYRDAINEKVADTTIYPLKGKYNKRFAVFTYTMAIFNPEDIDSRKENLPVRLSHIAPAWIAWEKWEPLREQSPVIKASLTVDKDGQPTDLKLKPESQYAEAVMPEIQDALKQWKFLPARKEGKNIEQRIDVTIFIRPDMSTRLPPPGASSSRVIPPKAIEVVEPEYPRSMRRHGLEGIVMISFTITEDGAVSNPVIIDSNNPAFEAPALDAIMKWKFEPATRDGKPVKYKARQEITFSIEGGGKDMFNIPPLSKSQKEKLPEQLRFDTPPQIRSVILPIYPYELIREKVNGSAKISMLVNDKGEVIQTLVTGASRPEFGLALEAAINHFSFKPALKDGKRCMSLVSHQVEFDYALQDPEIYSLLKLEEKSPEKIYSAKDLAEPLKALSQRPPKYPATFYGQKNIEEGNATVVFLIDKEGFVRLPRIVSASKPEFGYAAVQAVAHWRFEPPLSKEKRKPVVTKVSVPIRFTID